MTSKPTTDHRNTGLGSFVVRNRYALIALVDSALWALVLPAAAFARFDFDWSRVDGAGVTLAVAVAIITHLLTGYATGLYLGRRKLASFEEVGWVVFSATVAMAAVFFVMWLLPGMNLVPRSAMLAAWAYEIVGSLAFRYLVRVLMESRRRTKQPRSHRLMIFGAGDAGEQAAKVLQEDPEADLLPVVFLDDDPAKARLRLGGLRIAGGRGDIRRVAAAYDAGVMLIAIPSMPHDEQLELAEVAQAEGLSVRVLPRLEKFLTDPVEVKDIRQLTLADFLSREEVRLDLDKISRYIDGKVVLVTGAGGSIGAQLCETVREYAPRRVLMLDHSENGLHSLELRLDGRALLTSPDLLLADIRDRGAVRQVFDTHRPDVVFHAAAHKHVTFLERHPAEGLKTNVLGTLNVLEAAVEYGVERFVNVSTDKAADPVNVLGLTKRLAERLTSHTASRGPGVFMSVRFGNVLGSDGSVIPTFREQIARGEPITITHHDATRYFMTIREAVQLVVEAGALGRDGDVLVLDMGEPVRIVDLAHRLAAEVSPGVPPNIEYTGLREGEKLHEQLISSNDELLDRPHELLKRFHVPPVSPAVVHSLERMPAAELVDAMRDLETGSLVGRP